VKRIYFNTPKPSPKDRAANRTLSATHLLDAEDRGSEDWWHSVATIGTPLVERLENNAVRISFLWRDTSADEEGSPCDHVYIDVNGVTDHHSFTPQGLERITGTDIWFWQSELPARWRGSYAFIPVGKGDSPPIAAGSPEEQRQQQRAWWSNIAIKARPDPLNTLRAHPSGWGGLSSPLHLPDAPDQASWHCVDDGGIVSSSPTAFEWHSALQAKRRMVWSHVTTSLSDAPPDDGYPLVLLLDGQNWVERMPITPVLDTETAAGRLPPAHYLLIDSINGHEREQDLPPNPLFWTAIWDELLPIARDIAPISENRDRRIVAGQSYGGLAALYAALDRPDRFGGVVAQSPSLWWPDSTLLQAPPGAGVTRRPGAQGWLTEQLRNGALPNGHLRVFMEVGSREDVMIDVADTMHDALIAAKHALAYRIYEGGHDALCWRGGLVDGLRWMLAAPTQDKSEEREI
jgi:enterochelin esterase family protein